jgi:hypothetical protein
MGEEQDVCRTRHLKASTILLAFIQKTGGKKLAWHETGCRLVAGIPFNMGRKKLMADDRANGAGFFVDWDGHARSTDDPGGGYLCDVDRVAKYVAVTTANGTLVHEATYYKTLEAVAKAGIKAPFVPGSHPWGKPEEGF